MSATDGNPIASIKACINNEAKMDGGQRYCDLQAECKKHGIHAVGSSPILIGRLERYL